MAGIRSPRLSFLELLALAIGCGTWLRLDQLASQLLREDERHALYRVVQDPPAANFLVWQKPYRYTAHGLDVPIAADVAHGTEPLAARIGPPVYEGASLVVYRPSDGSAACHGGR